MRDLPTPELMELLERLGLAPRLHWRSIAAVARRIAGSLPLFDSVWLDALVRLRLLTPYQSREIGAGRGLQLIVGSHVIRKRRMTLGYAEVLETAEQTLVLAKLEPQRQDLAATTLVELAQRMQAGTAAAVIRLDATGTDRDSAWAALESLSGVQASDWMVENGRFPPRVVMHLARQMLIGLCELERQGLEHGDLRTSCLFIERTGQVRIAFAGLRDALLEGRPDSSPELPPECFDTLAPERARDNAPADIASDLFACGCLWWQLLTGRPAIPGGNSASKRANALIGKVPDVRKFAPDVPEVLAELIAKCTQFKPAERPRSFAEMAATLGPPSELGAKMIANCLRRPERWVLPRPKNDLRRGRVAQLSLEVVAVSVCLLIALLGWRIFGRTGGVVMAQLPKTPRATSAAPVDIAATKVEPSQDTPVPQSPPATKVNFQEPIADRNDRRGPEPLRLPEGRLVRLASLHLEDGQRVCGEHDGRVSVQTPPEGLVVGRADVRFEKLDFVAHSDAQAAMLRLSSATASFVDCTFRGPEQAAAAQPAIRWESPSQTDEWEPASDLLELSNCIFDRVSFAVERERERTSAIEAHNVLQTRSSGFLHAIATGKSVATRITLENCTLRETGPVVCVDAANNESETPGRLIVSAVDSVFAIQPRNALIECHQAVASDVEDRIKWSGRDSLLGLETSLVAMANADGEAEADSVDEEQLSVVGLGRSSLTFSEQNFDSPAASRLHRWVAARKSRHPPGILEKRLPPGFGESMRTANSTNARSE